MRSARPGTRCSRVAGRLVLPTSLSTRCSGPSPRRTWTSAALHGTAASGTRASRSAFPAEEVRATEPSGPAAAARTAVDWVRDRLRYEIGATDVTTPADSALSRGKGVCQDFAHLALGLLRSLGIPGRYVSGYLHPKEDGEIGETVEGQGHAWIEWWCGAWTAWDPTHGQPVGHRHVLVGRGRDYADVPPLKGIYQGAPSIAHEVTVAITRKA